MKSFSIALASCISTLQSVGQLRNLNNSDTLIKIADRLPFHLFQAWQKTADTIMYEHGDDISIEDLYDFVEKAVRRAENPLFPSKTRTAAPQRLQRPRQRAFATMNNDGEEDGVSFNDNNSTNVNNKECFLCLKNDHYLNQCNQFRELSYNGRKKFVLQNRLCFSCLCKNHRASQCSRRKPCKKLNCRRNHATLLHPPPNYDVNNRQVDYNANSNNVNENNSNDDTPNETNQTSCYNAGECNDCVFLPIVAVNVKSPNNGREIQTYALLDSGSDSTYCSNALLSKLNVRGKRTKVHRSTLTNNNEIFMSQVISDLKVSDIDKNVEIPIPHAFAQDTIPVSKNCIATPNKLAEWGYLQMVYVPMIDSGVEMIIGNDVKFALEPIEVIPSENDGPYAVRTRLGWALNGHCNGSKFPASNLRSFFCQNKVNPLCELCTDFVDSIKFGKQELSIDQRRFLDGVKSSISLKENKHYEVPLPVRDRSLEMPDNKQQAVQRLNFLKSRFLKDKKFYDDYKTNMNTLLKDGFAEEIEPGSSPNPTWWYLSHFGVFHPKKPDKLRVVFDASAKFKGMSLNDNLLAGPDLTNSLVGVLIRFRQDVVAFQGDIKSMFYQVHLPSADMDYFRFIWWPDGDYSKPYKIYRMKVHLFGAVSSPSVANFALKQTAIDFKEDFSPETCSTVAKNFYVDDCLRSTSSSKSAIKIVQELRDLLSRGGFRLTKFVSNDVEVLSSIPEEERASNIQNLDICTSELPLQTALGVTWNIKNDALGYSVNISNKPITRRGILSTVNSVFDPLGFLSPFILPAKLILQELSALKLDWDAKCSDEHAARWQKWLVDLNYIKNYSIDRCIKPDNLGDVKSAQIHHFSDASSVAVATASYLRLIDSNDNVHITLLFAKSRLVPPKRLSIPRLELTAAVLSIQSEVMLKNELEIALIESQFWCDSMTVLYYIKNESKSFHTFVSNRVNKIRDVSKPNQWSYVPTKQNISDVASRGLTGEKFVSNEMWKSGPDFLKMDESNWPSQASFSRYENKNDDVEIKRDCKSFVTQINQSRDHLDYVMGKFSSWLKLKRVIAWVMRFKNALKRRVINKDTNAGYNAERLPLDVEELQQAEHAIVKYCQFQVFREEIEDLSSNISVGGNGKVITFIKRKSRIIKLSPFLKHDVLHVGGRIDKSSCLTFNEKHPIILTKEMPITNLVIDYYHKLCGHGGREQVLAQIRKFFWVVKANSCVRGVLSKCVPCRKRRQPVGEQYMSSLPEDRIDINEPPFTNVGLDYFGPFLVKRGRSEVKRYGVVFTCLTVRAVHIEISESLSTDSFLMALRRFLSRRGAVKMFRSDNGTNFVGGVNELKRCIESWNKEQIHDFLLQQNIKWVFNAPGASHAGGVWERMIRTIRQIFMSLVREQTLNDESLSTFMCETEAIINGRPLTVVSSDSRDLNPISPNDLLIMKPNDSLPPGIFETTDTYSKKRWRHVQYLANVFWSRFKNEYLLSLQKRQKWLNPVNNYKVGDIVVVVDGNMPRNKWCLGKVIEVFPDKLNMIRKVKVKTKESEIVRPITKLCLLLTDD